jgi:RimJ/RimL family protein N-acetyltransferase
MTILETERLILRLLTDDDAEFYLRLINQPSWLRNIGNRGIHTVDNARLAIAQGPLAMHASFGFCLYAVEGKAEAAALGLCGLIKRETLEDVDIGYAFLDEHGGKGYAYEAAAAVLEYASSGLGLRRVVAITAPDNARSIRLIGKLGLRFEQQLILGTDTNPTNLYAIDFHPAA